MVESNLVLVDFVVEVVLKHAIWRLAWQPLLRDRLHLIWDALFPYNLLAVSRTKSNVTYDSAADFAVPVKISPIASSLRTSCLAVEQTAVVAAAVTVDPQIILLPAVVAGFVYFQTSYS